MIDLVKIIASENFLDIIEYVKENPGHNASYLAKKLKIHIVTVQRTLDTLEKYGFISIDEKRGSGRPSKTYFYKGGSFKVDINELLNEFSLRSKRIRESGREDIAMSYDIDREIVNALLIGGKKGKKIRFSEKEGRFLWLIPPPDSRGEVIEVLARETPIAVPDAIKLVLEMQNHGIVEVI